MFCPSCGAVLADDAKFCGRCGNQIEANNQEQPSEETVELPAESAPVAVEPALATPVAEEPVYTPPVAEQPVFTAPQPAPQQPLGRMKYIGKQAPGKVKAMNWVSWIACILCVVLLFVSAYMAVATPILELPIMKSMASVIPDMDTAMDELKDELEQGADQLKLSEQEFDMIKEQLPKEERKTAEAFFEVVEGFDEDLSIMDVRNTAEAILMIEDEELQDILDLEATDEVEEVADAFDMIFLVSIVLLAAVSLVLLLGALFKLNTLTVISMLAMLPLFFILGGAAMTGIAFVLFVVAIVAHCIINSDYKKYRKSVLGIA